MLCGKGWVRTQDLGYHSGALWPLHYTPGITLHLPHVISQIIPLIPLILAGNSTPTIPSMFSKSKDSGFLYGCPDAAATDWRQGNNVYEVNQWLWFGRGKPRLGGLTIAETVRRSKAAPAWFKVHGVVWQYVQVCTSMHDCNIACAFIFLKLELHPLCKVACSRAKGSQNKLLDDFLYWRATK
jgi:hypothetical protein